MTDRGRRRWNAGWAAGAGSGRRGRGGCFQLSVPSLESSNAPAVTGLFVGPTLSCLTAKERRRKEGRQLVFLGGHCRLCCCLVSCKSAGRQLGLEGSEKRTPGIEFTCVCSACRRGEVVSVCHFWQPCLLPSFVLLHLSRSLRVSLCLSEACDGQRSEDEKAGPAAEAGHGRLGKRRLFPAVSSFPRKQLQLSPGRGSWAHCCRA